MTVDDIIEKYRRERMGECEHGINKRLPCKTCMAATIDTLEQRENALEAALDALVHANEDSIDDYERIGDACDAAKVLLPGYEPVEEDE